MEISPFCGTNEAIICVVLSVNLSQVTVMLSLPLEGLGTDPWLAAVGNLLERGKKLMLELRTQTYSTSSLTTNQIFPTRVYETDFGSV